MSEKSLVQISDALIEALSSALKGVFVGCVRITAQPDVTRILRIGNGGAPSSWPTNAASSRKSSGSAVHFQKICSATGDPS
jgi:hypothetical protein